MENKKVGLSSLTPTLRSIFLLLCIIGVILPCILGFVNFDTRIDSVETCQKTSSAKNIEQDGKIVDLEKREIARNGEYSMLRKDAERTEAKLDIVISELKRFERSE